MTMTREPDAASGAEPRHPSLPPPPAASARPSRKRTLRTWVRGGGLSTLVFLAPMLLVFTVFSWSPIVRSVVMSLQETNLLDAPTWVGLDNFVRVLNDPLLGTATANTLYFAALALLFGFPLPIIVAVLMSEVRRAKGFYSALAYLPVVVPPVVAVLLWKVFYDASPTGLFNTILGWVGIPPQPWLQSSATAMPSLVLEATWAAAGGSIIIYLAALLSVPPELYDAAPTGVFNTIIGWVGIPPQPWLQSAASAMPSLVLEATWAGAGGSIIIYLAALLSVPPELYDAAEVDGASIWNKIWHVTLPQLRGILFIMLILQVIATAQVFLEPFLFTGGGPNNATVTILLLIYRYAFQNSLGGDYGEATALSVMLAIVLALLSWLYFKLTERWSS